MQQQMKLAVVGRGAMGNATRLAAEQRGHQADQYGRKQFSAPDGADAAVYCSEAGSVQDCLDACLEARLNLVIVTTGWYDQLERLRERVGQRIGVLWSSNFSVGMNIYFRLVQRAAEMMNRFDEYDVWGAERHHRHKADSPSGTAKTLGRILLNSLDRKGKIAEDRLDRRREDNEIHFSSVRGGEVNFMHEIGFDSAADSIRLVHSAHNRSSYALGAVLGAEWLRGRKGFFGVEEFMDELTGGTQ